MPIALGGDVCGNLDGVRTRIGLLVKNLDRERKNRAAVEGG